MTTTRRRGRGAPSLIDNPVFAKTVSDLIANGLSRQAILDELTDGGIEVKDKDTITRWKRDPRIKALVGKLIDDRAMQISRKVDSVIEGRLSQAENLPTEVLLKIRKEYGGATVQRKEIADDAVTAAALNTMENDPTFAEEFEKLLTGAGSPAE